MYSIESSLNLADLEDINAELGLQENIKKKQEKPIVEKVRVSGFDVYIGKNNKQNDYIVSKLAK